jgi:hypothetical protein
MRLGSNTAQVVGGTVASGSGVAASILALSPAAGPAAPIVAAVGAIIGLISDFVGKGCGNACVESAQQEQVYEVAADICNQAVYLGMIPQADWANIKSAILQAGTASLQQLEASGDKSASGGLSNMTSVINALNPPSPVTPIPYNWSQLLQAWLATTNPSGWYAASLSAGEQLAEQILSQVASSSPAGAVEQIASSILPAQIATMSIAGIPLGTLLVWGVIGFVIVKLL